jgi:hypothetical protein
MHGRRRAVVKFPIEYSLFVNQKALYSITGMTKYYIKSASGGEHFLPLKVPLRTPPELPTLDQDTMDSVLDAVRGDVLALFDLLAPIAGLELDNTSKSLGWSFPKTRNPRVNIPCCKPRSMCPERQLSKLLAAESRRWECSAVAILI